MLAKHKVTVLITALNEQEHILQLLFALAKQTYPVDEIVIVDGGSTDKTRDFVAKFNQAFPKMNVKLIQKKSNISQARNIASKAARNNLLASIDVGCIPQFDWLEKLIAKYDQTQAPVVAGFYFGLSQTDFQKAVIPYVLIMPDKLNPATFLPATRSMLYTKEIWQQMGGFKEYLQVSEDLDFARRIKKAQIPISVATDAKVGWIPRTTLAQFIQMISKFAYYDVVAGIFRPKVGLIFGRYLIGLSIISFFWYYLGPESALIFLASFLGLYCLWSISKNIRYARSGWPWLPVLQISSDVAIMIATTLAIFHFSLLKLLGKK